MFRLKESSSCRKWKLHRDRSPFTTAERSHQPSLTEN